MAVVESPSLRDPGKWLLTYAARRARRVKVRLHDANSFGWSDTEDVAGDDVAKWYRVVDLQYGKLVAAGTVDPHQLAVDEQAASGIGRVEPDQRASLRVTRTGCDEARDEQPLLEPLRHPAALPAMASSRSRLRRNRRRSGLRGGGARGCRACALPHPPTAPPRMRRRRMRRRRASRWCPTLSAHRRQRYRSGVTCHLPAG